MKKIKKFKNKKIKVRSAQKEDLQNAARFQKYINKIIEDPEAYILWKEKLSLEEEKEKVEKSLKKIQKSERVNLVAEDKNKVISLASISLRKGVEDHIGGLAISVLREYRGMGLGEFLLRNIIKLANEKIKPKPEMIRLSVASLNEPAISLYKKVGFQEVARIPEQLKYEGKNYDEIVMLKRP